MVFTQLSPVHGTRNTFLSNLAPVAKAPKVRQSTAPISSMESLGNMASMTLIHAMASGCRGLNSGL